MKVVESMYHTEMHGYEIRVWRDEKEFKDEYDNSDLTRALKKLKPDEESFAPPPKKDVIVALVACGRVNAVEVKDRSFKFDPSGAGVKQGIVYYTEWP